jgi:hypothetical protein
MGAITRNTKACATCQYWMGYRDISKEGPYVNFQQKGQCTSARSTRSGKETRGNDFCGFWHKWNALK